jgi:hypothetical protein
MHGQPNIRFALEYAINQDGLKLRLNGTHQLVVYADDVNIILRYWAEAHIL